MRTKRKICIHLLLLAALTLSGCSFPFGQQALPTPTPTLTDTPANTPTPTLPAGPTEYPPPVQVIPTVSAYPAPPTLPVSQATAYPAPVPTQAAPPDAYPLPEQTQAELPATRQPEPAGTLPASGETTPTPGPPVGTPGTALPTATERFATAAPPPENQLQTVRIWHAWNASEQQTLIDILDIFQDFYPNVIFDVLYVPQAELRSRYIAAASTGRGPSLLLGPAEWGGLLYEQGLVQDISDIATDEFIATLLPAALGEVEYQGAIIGLPYSIDGGVVLFRNTELVPEAPATWDDLVSQARAATGGGKVGAYLERSYYYAGAHLYGIGGRLADDEGNPAFANEDGLRWIELLRSFDAAGATDFESDQDVTLFENGRIGMIIDGTWNMHRLAEAIGSDNLAIDPWPAYEDGYLSGFLQTENIYINANATGGEEYSALLFMGFLLSPEIQAVLVQQGGHIPVVRGTEIEDALIAQAVAAFEGATPYPIDPEMTAYWDALNLALWSIFREGADPRAALAAASQEIQTQIRAGQQE